MSDAAIKALFEGDDEMGGMRPYLERLAEAPSSVETRRDRAAQPPSPSSVSGSKSGKAWTQT